MGGHTLARHVGKTDAELAARLRREPRDLERVDLYRSPHRRAQRGRRTGVWRRQVRRMAASQLADGPISLLYYADRGTPLGRSLSRGQQASVSCYRAIVVLRWDERLNRFYVLTSYPEAER